MNECKRTEKIFKQKLLPFIQNNLMTAFLTIFIGLQNEFEKDEWM